MVQAFDVDKKTTYTLHVKGDDSDELKTYKGGEFLVGDNDLEINYLKIKKNGTSYTITEY